MAPAADTPAEPEVVADETPLPPPDREAERAERPQRDTRADAKADAEPDTEPDTEPEERRESGRRKKGKKKARRPAWLPFALAGAAAFVLLGCCSVGGLLWFFLPGGGPANIAAKGGAKEDAKGDAAPVAKRGEPAREPEPGPGSWVPAVAPVSADPDQWKAAPDPPAARAAALASFFSLPIAKTSWVYSYALHPNPAHAAVIATAPYDDAVPNRTFEWHRFDLARGEPIGKVSLAGKDVKDSLEPPNNVAPIRAALSPSGKRVAVQDGRGRFVEVWGDDGQRVGRIPFVVKSDQPLRWLGFGGEDRLWLAAGPRLTQWDVKAGKQTAEVPGDYWGHPCLSPGGKYLAAVAGGKILVLAAADGTAAGSIDVPGKIGDGQFQGGALAHVAFDPSGKSLAASLADPKLNVIAVAWDMATGKRTDAVLLPMTGDRYNGGVQWVGGRRLIMYSSTTSGGHLLDLDLHALVTGYYEPEGISFWRGMVPPDDRLWHLRKFHDFEVKKLEGKLLKSGDHTSPWALTAGALPRELTGAIDEARAKGVLWHPGAPCRLAVSGKVVTELLANRTDELLESTATRMAKMGYRVDPNAPLTLELELGVTVVRSLLLKDGKPALDTGYVQTDSQPPLHQLPALGAAPALVPPVFLRGADFRQLPLPRSFRPGIDGVLEPSVEAGHLEKDKLGPQGG